MKAKPRVNGLDMSPFAGFTPLMPRTPRQATRRRCEAGFLASRVITFARLPNP